MKPSLLPERYLAESCHDIQFLFHGPFSVLTRRHQDCTLRACFLLRLACRRLPSEYESAFSSDDAFRGYLKTAAVNAALRYVNIHIRTLEVFKKILMAQPVSFETSMLPGASGTSGQTRVLSASSFALGSDHITDELKTNFEQVETYLLTALQFHQCDSLSYDLPILLLKFIVQFITFYSGSALDEFLSHLSMLPGAVNYSQLATELRTNPSIITSDMCRQITERFRVVFVETDLPFRLGSFNKIALFAIYNALCRSNSPLAELLLIVCYYLNYPSYDTSLDFTLTKSETLQASQYDDFKKDITNMKAFFDQLADKLPAPER